MELVGEKKSQNFVPLKLFLKQFHKDHTFIWENLFSNTWEMEERVHPGNIQILRWQYTAVHFIKNHLDCSWTGGAGHVLSASQLWQISAIAIASWQPGKIWQNHSCTDSQCSDWLNHLIKQVSAMLKRSYCHICLRFLWDRSVCVFTIMLEKGSRVGQVRCTKRGRS